MSNELCKESLDNLKLSIENDSQPVLTVNVSGRPTDLCTKTCIYLLSLLTTLRTTKDKNFDHNFDTAIP